MKKAKKAKKYKLEFPVLKYPESKNLKRFKYKCKKGHKWVGYKVRWKDTWRSLRWPGFTFDQNKCILCRPRPE